MKTPRFSGPFRWSVLRQQLLSLREDIQSIQKVAGRNVSIDEHRGKGKVINVLQRRSGVTGLPCDPPENFFSSITISVSVSCSETSGGTSGSSSADWNWVARPSGHEADCLIAPGEGGPDQGTYWLYSYRSVDNECLPCFITDGSNTQFGFFDDDNHVGAVVAISFELLTLAFVPNGCGYGLDNWIQDSGSSSFTGPGTYNFSGHQNGDSGTTYSGSAAIS